MEMFDKKNKYKVFIIKEFYVWNVKFCQMFDCILYFRPEIPHVPHREELEKIFPKYIAFNIMNTKYLPHSYHFSLST